MSARSRADVDLDRDMQLLVGVFEQCIHPDIDASSTFWLTRCQETDVIRASLDLFVHVDLVGLSDLPLLLSRKQPLYAPHILLFHMALVSNPTAAERFASEGVLAAYSNNFISSAISSGLIDVVLPELPVQRSPAHLAYCSRLSIIATVITGLGRQTITLMQKLVGLYISSGIRSVAFCRGPLETQLHFLYLRSAIKWLICFALLRRVFQLLPLPTLLSRGSFEYSQTTCYIFFNRSIMPSLIPTILRVCMSL